MTTEQRLANRRKGQRGNAGIEAALVVLPFFAMMIGIVNLGLAFFLNDVLLDRVRVASRYAALNPENTAAIQNFVLYGSPFAPGGAVISGASFSSDGMLPQNDSDQPPAQTTQPFLGLTPGNISVVRVNVGTDFERVVLTVSGYQTPFFIPGFIRNVVGGPIVASAAVEKM